MKVESISAESLQILRETLDIGPNGKRRGYRNRYVAKTGTAERALCVEMVKTGLMAERSNQDGLQQGEVAYAATESGRAAMASLRQRKTNLLS